VIWNVPEIIAQLSRQYTLVPGDLISREPRLAWVPSPPATSWLCLLQDFSLLGFGLLPAWEKLARTRFEPKTQSGAPSCEIVGREE
jgi:hypothetical protein